MRRLGPLRRWGAALVFVLALVAAFGPFCAPYAPDAWDGAPFEAPSRQHWLGTDDLGQDLWSQWLYGARHSFWIALVVASCATFLGTLVGAGAGYRGGWWNFSAMRLVDFALTLPTLPLVLVVAFYVGPQASWLVAVMVFASWARCAREIQPAAAALREVDSVVSARAMGAGESHILLSRIFPLLTPQIFGQFARLAHRAVLLESAVAFLGLGDSRWVSWGATLYYANARAAFLGESWWWWVLPPGLGIALLVTGFALLGVGEPRGAALRAAAEPGGIAPAAPKKPVPLLAIRSLALAYGGHKVLRGVDLQLDPGEQVGLIGLSGAGKSTLVQAVLGLLPPGVEIEGGVFWQGEDCLRLVEPERRRLRGAAIAWIPQAAMLSLNPVRTVFSQLREVARYAGRQEIAARVAAVLERVGLAPELRDAYPHQLSGGMRQRVVIAMVLLRKPRLLLADEATSGLDRDRADEILDLLTRLCREEGMAMLSIAHDFATLGRRCDRLAILDQGTIVETGRADIVFEAPSSTLGRALQAALRTNPHAAKPSPKEGLAVLELVKVSFSYREKVVLEEVDLTIRAGEAVGLVGPSGAGKTTLARLALGLLVPTSGRVSLLGEDLASLHRAGLRRHRRQAHLIFQDPFAALPWHQNVERVVAEPLRLGGMKSAADIRKRVVLALAEAGLPDDRFLERPVDNLSGGERQRVALARALVAGPRVIIADEPTSMLDAPAKRAWLEHLDTLRRKHGLAVLLITHDLEQAQTYSDRVVRLEQGRLLPTSQVSGPASEVPQGRQDLSPG